MIFGRWGRSVLIGSGALVWSLEAAADPSAEQAERRFAEGIELATAGRYGDACPKFEESQRLDPAIGTQYNLADCYEHTHRPASAWGLFMTVTKAARAAGKSDRERAAKARADALAPRLPRLKLIFARFSGFDLICAAPSVTTTLRQISSIKIFAARSVVASSAACLTFEDICLSLNRGEAPWYSLRIDRGDLLVDTRSR